MAEPITDRELHVLRQISAGMSDKEIADRLEMTVNTVNKQTFSADAKAVYGIK